jgi:hypothetical protein
MALFGRQVRVTVGSLAIENLDVEFKVTKSLQPEPNKAMIRIFNLNRAHREQLEQQTQVPVELFVGYEESETANGLIYRGTLRRPFSVLEIPDWVTTIRTGDSEKETRSARVNKSFSPGVTFDAMLKEAANALGVGLGNAIEAFSKGKFEEGAKSLFSGGILQGSAHKEMKRLLRSANLEFSVQDGELQVLEIGKALQSRAQVLSPTTGLIGSPQFGTKGQLKVRCLLIPDVFPGRKIQVKSSRVDGLFRVEKASYTGNTRAADWYIDLEAKELPQ